MPPGNEATQCLSNYTVLASGMLAADKRDIKATVEALGGIFQHSPEPDKPPTVLIAGQRTDTFNDLLAKDPSLPVVSKHWLRDCCMWKKAMNYDPYRLGIFYSLVFSMTGYTQEEREQMKAPLEENGGLFKAELNCEHVTHLLAKNCKGKKFEHAQGHHQSKGKPHIVTSEWLLRSIAIGYCLSEDDFPVINDITDNDQRYEG